MGGKQKVVMKIPVNDEKSRSRALKTAVSAPGCLSAAIEGADKNMIVVVGVDIDSVCLTRSLRKKFGAAELVTVASVDDKKKDEKKDEKKDDKKPAAADGKDKKPEIIPLYYHAQYLPIPQGYPVYGPPPPPDYNPDPCTIL